MQEDPYYQIILILIYSGVRLSELLNLKKEDVHLDEQYFDVKASKTSNGLRKVPIADVNQTIIKRIAGHSGAMNLTERVYIHFDIKELVDAINLI